MCVFVCIYLSERGQGGSDLVVEPLGPIEALERQARPQNFA